MEPLRFDVNLDKLPAATVVDGTMCPTCHDERVIVASKMIEVQRVDVDAPLAFSLLTYRQCKSCGRCRCDRRECPQCP